MRGVFITEPSNNVLVAYNSMKNNCFWAIQIYGGSSNINIYNNVMVNFSYSLDDPSGSAISAGGSSVKLRNNIIYNDFGTSFYTDGGSANNVDEDYNLFYPASSISLGAHSSVADPLLIDAANEDFRLQSNSPAINAGVDVGLTQDLDQNSIVGVPDIGAYEYQGTPTDEDINIIFSQDFEHRPFGKYLTEAEFIADWGTSWETRGEDFEIVQDPLDPSNKVGMFTFPFYDSADFKWICWGDNRCYGEENKRVIFDERPSFGHPIELNGASGSSVGGSWFVPLGDNYEEAYISYKIRLESDFNPVVSGKFFGVYGKGSGHCGPGLPTDCRYANGTVCSDPPCDGIADSFTSKHVWSLYNHERLYNLEYYLYFADKSNPAGDLKKVSNLSAIFDGNWHTLTLYTKMNDVDVHNGEVRTWIDGIEMPSWTGIMFRTGEKVFGIEELGITTYFGGSSSTMCGRGDSWNYMCSKGSIDDWIQYYYDICAVDPQDPCSDVLTYTDGTPYHLYSPRKTEYLYVDDIVVYIPN
jgi:hypothetical protein